MAKILVCDDDKQIVEAIDIYLTGEGFQVIKAFDGYEALELLEYNEVDLMIVDVMMPKMDGIQMTIKLREKHDFPVIFLSAKSEEVDKILGLNMGADDYVTKPFRMDILVSRIRAVLRRVRNRRPGDGCLYCGDVCINKKTSKVYKKDCPVELTPNEYQLLLLLLEHKNQTITREQILEKLWDVDGNYVNDNTLTTLVKRLRQKVEEHPQMPKMLLTVRGFGYKAVDYEG